VFVAAIDEAQKYTRAIHHIQRFHKSTAIIPSAATLFIVNADGWALTCKHVIETVAAGDLLFNKLNTYEGELNAARTSKKAKHLIRDLDKKYGYHSNATVELLTRFVNCVEGPLNFRWIPHNEFDLALIKFEAFTRLACTEFPRFAGSGAELKQGKSVCRLGFPFAEFSNFDLDTSTGRIRWTNTGREATPSFPIDGMVTRNLLHTDGSVFGFETTTPGIKGQSGGPVFDQSGIVWGMQFATNSLDLEFDVDREVVRGGRPRRVQDIPFLHVGLCIHVDVIKSFMTSSGVTFQQA
jgi:hypothetical protein